MNRDNSVMNDVGLIRDKYHEAEFFLNKMNETEVGEMVKGVDDADDDTFRYYLSAYLGAIYAIYNFMDKYTYYISFEEWVSNQGKKDLHRFLMERRHDIVHLERGYQERQPDAAETHDDIFLRMAVLNLTEGKRVCAFPEETLPSTVVRKYGEDLEYELIPVETLATEYLLLVDEWLNGWEK